MAERMYPIDGSKLFDVLKDRFGSVSAAGVKIGYSDSAFGNPCKRGEISEKLKIAAESILGVQYEEYAADVPTPRMPVPIVRRTSGEPCIYCKNDCSFLSDITENRFNLSVAILPKRKVLETTVAFGEDDHSAVVIADKIWINYCPNCGRKL